MAFWQKYLNMTMAYLFPLFLKRCRSLFNHFFSELALCRRSPGSRPLCHFYVQISLNRSRDEEHGGPSASSPAVKSTAGCRFLNRYKPLHIEMASADSEEYPDMPRKMIAGNNYHLDVQWWIKPASSTKRRPKRAAVGLTRQRLNLQIVACIKTN